ncbi:MAG: phage major capsid protein [Planctomycetes bacterium]|jgi:hypothetical protein|nr:phage major capsid protein [Planctomycetota bacterium]
MTTEVSLNDPRDLSNDILRDLLKTTCEAHPWDGKFESLRKYHDYPVCNMWFAEDRVVFDGGTSIVRNVQLGENGSAKFTRPYEPASPTVVDVQGRLRAEWVQATADYSISRQEIMRNRGRERLISLVVSRRQAAMEDLANLLEDYAWQSPSGPADDLHPMGIPYWISPITAAQQTAQEYGHQGGNPAGFLNCGGIDCSDAANQRWRNYNDSWAQAGGEIGDDDIIKITRMLRRLRFRSPVFLNDIDGDSYRNLRLYTNEHVLESLEEYARLNNDSIGTDIGKYAGATVIKNLPVIWVEQLDADETNPLYAINHACFHPFVMEGDFFRETGPMNSRRQHDVFTTFVDLQFNFICTNRQRAGGVISRINL